MTAAPAPSGRPAWLVPGLVALVALVVGVALTLALTGGSDDDDRAAPVPATPSATPSPSATASATPSAAASPSPSGASAPVDGEMVEARGIVLTLPDGWELGEEGDATVCVDRTPGGCELRFVDVDAAVEAAQGAFEVPNPDSDYGWSTATDVAACEGQDVAPSRRVERDTRPLGDRTADYAVWEVECTDGSLPARPRLWWLPRSRLAVFDETDDPSLDDEVDAIVRTADVSAVAAER